MKINLLYIAIISLMLTITGCTSQPSSISHAAQFEQRLKLKNSLQAVKNLASQWDADQKANLILLIEPIAKDDNKGELRNLATETLKALKQEM